MSLLQQHFQSIVRYLDRVDRIIDVDALRWIDRVGKSRRLLGYGIRGRNMMLEELRNLLPMLPVISCVMEAARPTDGRPADRLSHGGEGGGRLYHVNGLRLDP